MPLIQPIGPDELDTPALYKADFCKEDVSTLITLHLIHIPNVLILIHLLRQSPFGSNRNFAGSLSGKFKKKKLHAAWQEMGISN